MTEYGLGRHPHPETPQAAAAYPITAHPEYAVSSNTSRYYWEGGAWLDQGNTGTCVGNAFAHRLADSPHPEAGITEAYAQQIYVEASGDTTLQQGTSGLAMCRALARDGRITAYHWVTSPTELRNTVLTLGSVCIGIPWMNSMFQPYSQYANAYVKVDPYSGIAGGHEVLINGVNLAPTYGRPFYRIKNSWGRAWGKGGTARVYTTDLEELIFYQGGDAVLITETGQ